MKQIMFSEISLQCYEIHVFSFDARLWFVLSIKQIYRCIHRANTEILVDFITTNQILRMFNAKQMLQNARRFPLHAVYGSNNILLFQPINAVLPLQRKSKYFTTCYIILPQTQHRINCKVKRQIFHSHEEQKNKQRCLPQELNFCNPEFQVLRYHFPLYYLLSIPACVQRFLNVFCEMHWMRIMRRITQIINEKNIDVYVHNA